MVHFYPVRFTPGGVFLMPRPFRPCQLMDSLHHPPPCRGPSRAPASNNLSAAIAAKIGAATGIDAFVHCFEAYCAPGYHPMAEGIALEGMRLVKDFLPAAYKNGGDIEARGQMLAAADMKAVFLEAVAGKL